MAWIMHKHIAAVLLVATLAGVVAACEEQGPAEEIGEAVDDAAEEAGDAVEDAADAAEDAVN